MKPKSYSDPNFTVEKHGEQGKSSASLTPVQLQWYKEEWEAASVINCNHITKFV